MTLEEVSVALLVGAVAWLLAFHLERHRQRSHSASPQGSGPAGVISGVAGSDLKGSLPLFRPLHVGGGWMLLHSVLILGDLQGLPGPCPAVILYSPNGKHQFVCTRARSPWDWLCRVGSHPN